MVRERRNPRRGRLTMTTRSQERARAMYRLDIECTEYFFERSQLGARNPANPIVNELRKKHYILTRMGNMCERVRDHLLFPAVKYDKFAIQYVNAVCDGKPNAFSVEHPVLATYIKNMFDREIVTADISIRTLPYVNTGDERHWIDNWPHLYMNRRRVNRDEASQILSRLEILQILKKGHLITTRRKNGVLEDSRRLTLSALRLTPKKRTK